MVYTFSVHLHSTAAASCLHAKHKGRRGVRGGGGFLRSISQPFTSRTVNWESLNKGTTFPAKKKKQAARTVVGQLAVQP